jgi:RNA polymerase sigma-70 factor (ECF subfamily)
MRPAGRAASTGVPPAPCLRAFESEIDFILGSLRRQGVNGADAEDLAQEIFVIIWRRWSEYDDRRPIRPWIAGIIHKVASRHTTRRHRFLPRALLEVEDPRPGQDDQLASARARISIARALAHLTAGQRDVVVMHDLEGIPIREVARQQGVPLFTAYTRLRTGRKKLAKAIAEREPPTRHGTFWARFWWLAAATGLAIAVVARGPLRASRPHRMAGSWRGGASTSPSRARALATARVTATIACCEARRAARGSPA